MVRRVRRVTLSTQYTSISLPFLITILFPFIEFKYGKACILIATDVASRGLGQYFSRWLCLCVVSLPFFLQTKPQGKKQKKKQLFHF